LDDSLANNISSECLGLVVAFYKSKTKNHLYNEGLPKKKKKAFQKNLYNEASDLE
jgi:hypothetical protein